MKIITRKSKLKLTNDGKLELAFLGTGTTFSRNLFNNNIIIVKGNTHLLVDFGYNAPVALEKNLGLSPLDIEAFLPTHSHADHIGGIEFLLLYKRYLSPANSKSKKLKLITTKDYLNVLWNYSLKGGLEWNELSENTKMKLEDYFDVILAEPMSTMHRSKFKIKYKGLKLELFGTNHIPDNARTQKQAFYSYGIMIDDRIMFTSDTKFDKALLDIYADKAEIIFHDCSFAKNPVHASFEELRSLPAAWKKKMYLMHHNDDIKGTGLKEFGGIAREGVRYILD